MKESTNLGRKNIFLTWKVPLHATALVFPLHPTRYISILWVSDWHFNNIIHIQVQLTVCFVFESIES